MQVLRRNEEDVNSFRGGDLGGLGGHTGNVHHHHRAMIVMMERDSSSAEQVIFASLHQQQQLTPADGGEEGVGGGGGGNRPVIARVVVRPPKRLVSRRLILILGIFVILVLVAILISLVFHWYFSVLDDGEPRLKYNQGKMSSLQLKVVGRVRGLWEMANRSVHDTEARDYLRNLSKTDRSTCYSALCVHTSLSLLESMEWRKDPCEDFYAFACGGWLFKNPPDSPTSVTDHFAKVNDRVIQATQRIIQKTSSDIPSDSNKGLRVARSFYEECANIEQLEKDGLQPIYSILESHGGWPMLYGHAPNDSWKGRWSFNWLKLVATLQRLSIPTILSLEIKQDTAKSQSNAIFVVEPTFFLSREYLVSPKRNMRLLTSYKQFIIDVADELLRWKAEITQDFQINRVRLDDMAENVIAFEVSLAKLVTPEETTINSVKTFRDMEQLQNETEILWPNINPKNRLVWKEFLGLVFDGSVVIIENTEKILIHDMPFIQGVAGLLDRTPTDTIANYLLWRLMVKFTTGSTKALRKIHAKFYLDLYGEQRLLERNSTCAMVINSKFAIAIGSEFVKDSFESSLKREVETLAANVKVRMEELLGRQTFIPHLLQLAIRRKLTSIKLCVGYPRSFSNSTHVLQFYQDLDVRSIENRTYIDKYMKIATWLFLKSLAVLRQPFDMECWGGNYWSFIGEAYAYYDTARNSINLPIGLLQTPFYYQRPTVPWYLNYGGIGTIIGHELTHSLNIEGWIRAKLVIELETLLNCLISSYSEAVISELDGSKVDGYRTRSENFADHFGLASAFWAYQQHIKSIKNPLNEEEEQNLPGLEIFSSSQMFFISFANMWCDSQSKESLYDEVESSTHTPSKYRVLGALKNSKDFSTVWSCAPGSKMNPRHKCNLF